MFVTQVPPLVSTGGPVGDFAAIGSTFGNHGSGQIPAPRGGDLYVRYPDGTLRNLTKEAGCGMDGLQGANSIAVRQPSVHWSGTKALFSMVIGAYTDFPPAGSKNPYVWQIFEVSNFQKGSTNLTITKIPNQPLNVNNVSPIYGTNGRILFTSDMPRDKLANPLLYPQDDEYEHTPTVSGIWSLDPASGDLHILNHAPSGAFSPKIDSFGRVVFTRWDHLQRDQDNDDGDPDLFAQFGAINMTSEAANAVPAGNSIEVFPEHRTDLTDPSTPSRLLPTGVTAFGPINRHRFNSFTPWQMNEDGTEEETLNHIGEQELNLGFLGTNFASDTNLLEDDTSEIHANKKNVFNDGGLFDLIENPAPGHAGEFFATHAKEFGSLKSNQLVMITGNPALNADQMVVTDVTVPLTTPANDIPNDANSLGGRYNGPLPLMSGSLVASYTTAPGELTDDKTKPDYLTRFFDFRLKLLHKNSSTGFYEGASSAGGIFLTNPEGIIKTVTQFNPDDASNPVTFSGPLWERDAVEVISRTPPVRAASPLEAPEAKAFSDENVDVTAFKAWLVSKNLALIVSRNLTSRDDSDYQQPNNLHVPGGVTSLSQRNPGGKTYDVAHLQIFQADQIRARSGPDTDSKGHPIRVVGQGRRVLAQVLHDPNVLAIPTSFTGGPTGSVQIAPDGSMAAIVPARRALTWQLTDGQTHANPDGTFSANPVVRERVWLTFQPGEVRLCVSCHGANNKDQAGRTKTAPELTNEPQALRLLLQTWNKGH